jgi:hypothetical protein
MPTQKPEAEAMIQVGAMFVTKTFDNHSKSEAEAMIKVLVAILFTNTSPNISHAC